MASAGEREWGMKCSSSVYMSELENQRYMGCQRHSQCSTCVTPRYVVGVAESGMASSQVSKQQLSLTLDRGSGYPRSL